MNADVKVRWVEALRSGEYRQTRGALHRLRAQDDDTKPAGFCCLGVLCDLAEKEGVTVSVDRGSTAAYRWITRPGTVILEEGILPPSVMQWAGLYEPNPEVCEDAESSSLATLNDQGYSFEQIADVIEAEL